MNRVLWVLVVALALGGLFAWGLLRGRPDRNIASNYLGKPVPDFEMALFDRYWLEYGERFDTKDHRGKPMVVNFWASWCGPCYQEAPVLEAGWREHRENILFVGVDTQDRGNFEDATAFLERFDLSFPNGLDETSRIGIEYGLFGVPETFFVRADGTLSYKHTGPVTTEVLEQRIEALLR
ncbi:MAG: redoxin domain-containing protein [Trueperaceae bacterium]|nr:MAG: redoxin domain-containing protein [Trueperaceae bacterium]